jgi:hypothetical protein
MGAIRLITAPIRGILRSRLFQLVAVLAIVLLLDHYSFDYAALRQISSGLKSLVDATVQFCAGLFRIGILTDPVLQVGLIIAYVYLAGCIQMHGRRGGSEQLSVAEKPDCARARHRGLPGLGAA